MRDSDFPLIRMLPIAGLVLAVVASCDGSGGSSSAVEVNAGPVALRRLTAEQFARSIQDTLGEHITVPSRIDPDDRRNGLFAVGSSFASVTPSGFEKYDAAASAVAEQALDAAHRDDLVQCRPASLTSSDEECARAFVERAGRRLFRRSFRR